LLDNDEAKKTALAGRFSDSKRIPKTYAPASPPPEECEYQK
jgi:hypothetical protein